MIIVAAHSGSYPRIGDSLDQQKLRRAIESCQRGELSELELKNAQDNVAREALAEQIKAGLDAVSDGQVRRHDAVSHIMGQLPGVSVQGLLRYFDTNTYFRQPHVTSAISESGPLLADEVAFARAAAKRPVLVSLLGPLTLSRLSLIKGAPYKNADALLEALTPILAEEAARLAQAGADAIVIEEPFLLKEPAALSKLGEALKAIAARKGNLRLWLSITFGDAAKLYSKLQDLPIDGLQLDLTYGGAVQDAIQSLGSQLALSLGIVDARNTRLETPTDVARQAESLLKKARGPIAMLAASNGLEYLPRGRAFEKLAVLAQARDLLVDQKGNQ